MTRAQAISLITERLEALDDEGVATVADIVQSMATQSVLPRELTPHELALIEQSKEDFRAGRTFTVQEARAVTDQYLSTLGVRPSRK